MLMFSNIINHNRDMKKVIFLIIYSFVLSIVVLVGFSVIATYRTGYTKTIISCDDRPIVKDLKDKFCVSYYTESYIFSKDYYLFIAFGEEETYGFVMYYPDHDHVANFVNPKIEWLDDGMNITTNAGIEIFLKKELYSNRR